MTRMLTNNFTQLVTTGLRKVYFSSLRGVPQEGRQYLNMITPGKGTGLAFMDDLRVASFQSFGLNPQGQSVTYDAIVQDTTVRYTPYKYSLGFRLTEEMMEDELYGVMEKMTTELGYSARHQMEVQMFRPLNGAFSAAGGGTGYTAAGFGGEALVSTSHALVRGGTAANRQAVDLDLGVTALELAKDNFALTLNESGMPNPLEGSLLILPPPLKWVATEITESELHPYTGNNGVNPLGGEGLRYMIVHYLSNQDSWYLLSPKAQHDLNCWIRREPRFNTGEDHDTGDTKVRGTFRIAVGHGEWRGVFASQGA